MKRKGILIAAVFVVAAFALTGVVSAAGEPVDLFLIVDGSNSITPANYTLQLTGYADAIADSTVVPQNGNVSICVIMFGYWPPYYTDLEIPYTTITNQTVADAIADKILSMPQPQDHTPMADAFTLANRTLTGYIASGITSPEVRQIIDIATDGRPNKVRGVTGKPYQQAVNATYEARDDAIFKGDFDEVNVLGVDVKEEANPPAQPYNRDFLVKLNFSLTPANHSGFYMETTNWEEFSEAIKEKIRRELKPETNIAKNVNKAICNCSDVLSYTITYSNADNVDLTEVVLRDPIPSTTTVVQGTISNGGKVEGDVVVWNIGTLLIGESQTQSFDVTVHSNLVNGTIINNTATLTTNETGPKSASASTLVLTNPETNITKNVSKAICNCSDVLSYTITYSNADNVDLTEVVLRDPIPSDTTVVQGTISNGGKVEGGEVVWNIGTLLIGESQTQSFDVTVHNNLVNGTIINNTATLTTNETGPKSASASTLVLVPDTFELFAYKTVDKSFASPNDTLNYQIHYKNVGAGTLTNTTIHDTIPTNTTYILESMTLNGVSLTDAKDEDAGTYYPGDNKLIWDIGTLAPGASGDATFKVKIDAFVAGGTVIRNTAILTTDETEPVKPSVITKIREPAPLPVIMPLGIAVLIGLLSLVAIRGIFGRRR
ncbi:hypothetical protein C5S35_08910 [Candidatus Methanophagaceae archaeon]|nr:hypothetical protein C5S35_08910 [Methanophagales archaeon]